MALELSLPLQVDVSRRHILAQNTSGADWSQNLNLSMCLKHGSMCLLSMGKTMIVKVISDLKSVS